MSILTTSQLTFCDLKDSYSVHLDTDCIGVACDKDGNAIVDQIVTINYGGYMGSTRIGLKCSVMTLPGGVEEISNTPATSETDGVVELKITQGTNLDDSNSSSAKLVFRIPQDPSKEDIDETRSYEVVEEGTEEGGSSNEFTFEKYISFVKYMAGADAVSFQIYSTDGYEFSDEITNIQLNTIAFCGGSPLADGVAEYQWDLYTPGLIDQESGEGSPWTAIPYASFSTLSVSSTELEVLPASIRCTITIDDRHYEAYVHLTHRAENYTSRIGFFNESSVFNSDNYIVAYMELYKNNKRIDELPSKTYYYSSENRVSENDITTDVDMSNVDGGDMCYFIYHPIKSDDMSIDRNVYKIVLGSCLVTEDENGIVNKEWKVENVSYEYIYKNNIDEDSNLNVVVISKNDVNKTKNVFFEAYDSNSSLVSYANTAVFDLQDPIVSGSAPGNPTPGQLWLDTSDSTYVLKIYTADNEWQYFEQQRGNRVFASDVEPEEFSEGDLWVLNAKCAINGIEYGEGSMLQAISVKNKDGGWDLTWTDVMSDVTNTIANVKEVFNFNDGLTIAQEDIDTGLTPFYVHIDSKKMGFWDVEYNDDGSEISRTEVVHIGNKSAIIQNATLDGEFGTTVNNDIKFNKSAYFGDFVWAVRANGNYGLFWKGDGV